LLRQDEPRLTPDQIKYRLISTAEPGPVGRHDVDGYGSLNVFRAAHASTTRSANHHVTRSLGEGSLDLDRGTFRSDILVGFIGQVLHNLVQLVGDVTFTGNPFDTAAYVNTNWTEATWAVSQWTGVDPQPTRWDTTRPWGSQWWGSQWWGSQWWGSQWW